MYYMHPVLFLGVWSYHKRDLLQGKESVLQITHLLVFRSGSLYYTIASSCGGASNWLWLLTYIIN